MTNIKILIATHKPFKIPDGMFYVPMHSGRAKFIEDNAQNPKSFVYQWMLEHTVGDDTGDNISKRNENYCEWDILYWAWKNYDKLDNPDYIGLMHYRRHFIFNEDYYNSKNKNLLERTYGISYEDFIDKIYQERVGLNDFSIEKYCSLYDVVTSLDSDFSLIGSNSLRADYEQNIEGVYVKDFDLMIETIKKLYPDYISSLEKHINGSSKMCYGIFLMKKNIFFRYCKFVFDILFDLDSKLNFDKYSLNGKRTLGYLAEILFSVFIWKLEEENICKIKKLPVSQINYPYCREELNDMLSVHYIDYLFKKLKYIFTYDAMKKNKRKNEYKEVKAKLKFKSYYNHYVNNFRLEAL